MLLLEFFHCKIYFVEHMMVLIVYCVISCGKYTCVYKSRDNHLFFYFIFIFTILRKRNFNLSVVLTVFFLFLFNFFVLLQFLPPLYKIYTSHNYYYLLNTMNSMKGEKKRKFEVFKFDDVVFLLLLYYSLVH